MRYINMSTFAPSEAWQERSSIATKELENRATHEERMAYIKAHAQIWRDLREEFIAEFGNKCWFTDAEEVVAHLDVEHFRPKAEALDEDGMSHEGYWWLTFDFKNLRLAGQIPNRQHKRCYFPLLPGCSRANSQNRRWQDENPMFLDPTKLTDVQLVAYDETGGMRPSLNAHSDEDKKRVEVTNQLMGLSIHAPLLEARQRIWSDCWDLISKIENLRKEESDHGGSTARTKSLRDSLMEQLCLKLRANEPFASVAKSCLLLSGKSWAVTLTSIVQN